MKNTYTLLFLALSCFVTNAQTITYNDVAVIVNSNDSTSVAIGNYFKTKRNIPAINIIPINVPVTEQINDSTFLSLKSQVAAYMTTNNLVSSVNYLVTTKGCPLGVSRDTTATFAGVPFSYWNASVESELMMLNSSAYSQYIGDSTSPAKINAGQSPINPYYAEVNNFSRAAYNVYLVTRLDAYTIQDVFNMIDRSGPRTYVNQDTAQFIFDRDPGYSQPGYVELNNYMNNVQPDLITRGWDVLLNTDTVYVTGKTNVIGYVSWGSNDNKDHLYTTNAKPNNTWLPGSIGETYVSTGGRSFKPGTPYGQSLVADWIKEGITGMKAYVYEPFSFSLAHVDTLFKRYTQIDSAGTPKYNLAESFYAASLMMGWMDVVIGDPKSSITTKKPIITGIENKTKTFAEVQLYPNPAEKFITIRVQLAQEDDLRISIYDITGRLVSEERVFDTLTYSHQLDLSQFSSGIYFLNIQGEKGSTSRKFIVR